MNRCANASWFAILSLKLRFGLLEKSFLFENSWRSLFHINHNGDFVWQNRGITGHFAPIHEALASIHVAKRQFIRGCLETAPYIKLIVICSYSRAYSGNSPRIRDPQFGLWIPCTYTLCRAYVPFCKDNNRRLLLGLLWVRLRPLCFHLVLP